MDKGHEYTQQNLKRYPQTATDNEWDSAESDTESLAQERVYQQQLRLSNSIQNEAVLLNKKNNNTHQKYEGSEDDEADEALQVADSLEISDYLPVKKNPVLSQVIYLDSQRIEKNKISQVFSNGANSHMCYDPNQRTNLKGEGLSGESSLISNDESFLLLKEKPHRERKEAVGKDEYRLIVNTSPPVATTPQDHKYNQPYLLHPQHGPTSAITAPPPLQGNTLLLRPSVEDHNPREFHRKTDICNENPIANNSTSELTKQHAVHNQSETQGRIVLQMDKMVSAKDLSNKNKTEDIVERNKITLGRNTLWKYGSYAKKHALKTDTPQNATKVQQTLKETTSAEIQNEKSPQKTKKVKITQMSKGKKAQRKEGLIPSRPQLPPTPRVKAEQGDYLSSLLTKAAAKTQRKPPTSSSSQPLPSTIHLNINLNTTSHLQPFQSQKGQGSVINLVSLHGSPQVNLDVALSPRHQQSNPNSLSTMYQERVNPDLNHWNLENIPGQWQRDYRLSALKERLSYEEEDQEEGFTAVPITQFVKHLSGTPTSTLSQSSGSYKVLPPIRRPDSETEPKVSPGPTQAAQRRISDGYLMQMEKHKLLKTRPTYKVYSLKDYRQMNPNVTLQGLGPDYTATEKTAEKMEQQKLYSNVISQQNKKISRIPLLPAKDPESNDKKVTRLKALEYAKTIAKPFVPVQSKMKEKRPLNEAKGFSEHAPCVEGIDLSQLTTLELLRKRHEEEKQAVAQLRKTHAV